MKLINATPEVDNWIVNILNKSHSKIFSLEGYAVKDNKITAIFERRASDEDVDKVSIDNILNELRKEPLIEWTSRFLLAKRLNIPFYLIIWKENVQKYLVIEIMSEDLDLKIINLFLDSKNFAKWMASLKSITVKKKFVEKQRLASIDNDLRREGVPWPGNLDGFIYINNEIKSIIEFSRTRKNTVEKHDIRPFFNQDFNRWKPFEVLRKELHLPAYIILWSSSEEKIKVQKVKEITNNLYYEKEDLLEKNQIETFFS